MTRRTPAPELTRYLTALVLTLALLLPTGCGSQSPAPEKEAQAQAEPQAPAEKKEEKKETAAKEKPPVFELTFEEGETLSGDWESTGDVSVAGPAFDGKGALKLTRPQETINEPIYAVSPTFPLEQGSYDVTVATKTDLHSPDNSFLGAVVLETIDTQGKPGQTFQIVERDGKRNWQTTTKNVGIPANFPKGRIKAEIRKAKGEFWVDGLTVRKSVDKNSDPDVDRLFFDTAQMGNLLYPEDSKEVKATVWAKRELSDAERQLSFQVTDYWGAEMGEPLKGELKQTGKNKRGHFLYETKVDMSPANPEEGRYYELKGTLTKDNGEPFSHETSFAILPEAPANSHPHADVPFTMRTWDGRNCEAQYLAHRLGVRITGVWGRWKFNPPFDHYTPCFEVVEELGMGFLTTTPAANIEKRRGGWETWNEKDLYDGMQEYLKKFGHVRPIIINIGNEPHNHGDEIDVEMKAYEVIYKAVKDFDPTITVVGTSVGPNEEYFAKGLGKWCDAYDFHTYGDSAQVREVIEVKYPELFKKYGYPRPIWSTELGLNSQGMERHAVAIEVVKKSTIFFAAGGASMCWFGIMYPDPDNKMHDSFGSAHNLFDCRYNKFAPKMDAIAYYNMINGIAIKKFVTEKLGDELNSFLFRDKDGRALQVHYMAKGLEKDVFIPLPGVKDVMAIDIDGTRTQLNAGGKGITMTLNEDPVMLLYEGGKDELPELLPAAVQIASVPEEIVAGQGTEVKVALDGVDAKNVKLAAPYGWKVNPADTGASGVAFSLLPPDGTRAREATLRLAVMDGQGNQSGALRRRPPVTGAVDIDLRPVPAKDGGEPAVALDLRNNSPNPVDVEYGIELIGENKAQAGAYGKLLDPSAYFKDAPKGTVMVKPNSTLRLPFALSNMDPTTVYRLRAVVKDPMGRRLVKERAMGGFVGVPRAESVAIDGKLDEEAWKKAPVQVLDKADQYYALKKPVGVPGTWNGPEDLSGKIRFLWDDDYLYMAVTVKDDIWGEPQKKNKVWYQDSIQFLVDPTRDSEAGVGKYDYGFGLSADGPIAWNFLSADSASAPPGEVETIKLAVIGPEEGTGNMTYEVAVPWARLSPFQPEAGANLGLTMIFNEDDGHNRDSFLTWFGNAHNKDIDMVGDLVLEE